MHIHSIYAHTVHTHTYTSTLSHTATHSLLEIGVMTDGPVAVFIYLDTETGLGGSADSLLV